MHMVTYMLIRTTETFTFTLNLFKKVMANFLDVIKKKETTSSSQLTQQELEFILLLIKNSTFKGEQLEIIYNAAIKLQQQYLELKK